MSVENLKPCPFCGEDPILHESDTDDHGDVECFIFCKCDIPQTDSFDDKISAIKQWNTRA